MSIATVNYELQKCIRLLPGYDPFAQAGDCVFEEKAAQFVIDFVESCCVHVKGEKAGTPLTLESWQKGFLANLYGWKRPDGTRRFRESLVYIPRGNGKTLLAASLVCIHLFLDDEAGAELYSSAAERDQARLCFDMVAGMVRHEQQMDQRAKVYRYSIVVGDKTYKALSAEAGTKHGFSPQLIVNDEIHAHKTPELTEVLMTGTGKRRQPVVVHLTTADYERENSVCNQKHDYACKVRDGMVEDASFLPVIFEATRDDDWTSAAVWAKANPNLGVSVPMDYLERECERAKVDPAYENTFKRLHLNVRTEQAFRLIQMARWDACDAAPEIPEKASVVVGLDLASIEDMAAMVICHADEDGVRHVVPQYWCPESKVSQMEQRGDRSYRSWANQGLLHTTPGNSIDYRAIRESINKAKEAYTVVEVCFDPWNASHLATELSEEDGLPMVEHRQGTVSMNEPTKQLIGLMLDGKLRHGGHPILRWNMSNLSAREDPSGNLRPDKAASNGKIDGAVAAIMAVGRASWEAPRRSFYDDYDAEVG